MNMKKILVIEDNPVIRENISGTLELGNYAVVTAIDSKSGIEAAVCERPDLIICDTGMSKIDGYSVLHMIRKISATRNIPFIFLSDNTDREGMRKAMDLGADDYITVPFSETELLNSVESRLKKLHSIKEECFIDYVNTNMQAATADHNDILKSFTGNRHVNSYNKRNIIYSEGYRATCLYYICKGSVKTFKTNEDGKELVMNLYKPGDFIGIVSLLESTTYKETAEAIEPAEIAVIPKDDFDQLLNSNHVFARRFMEMLAFTITENEDRLLSLAYNSLRKKVAATLVAIYKKYKTVIVINRSNLASIAGTATESLIRTLGDFRNEQLIDFTDGAITILNERKLERLVN
jgi:CRP/FNR family cyclic AMP-dependent transcriptional regulator